jgi:peptide/nickel transport system permease protein
VGLACFIVVLAFIALACASAVGLVASDWGQETGVSYAPPGFLGGAAGSADADAERSEERLFSPRDDIAIEDPLHEELAAIAKALAAAPPIRPKAATLPLGGDKWGRDVLNKTIKGTETSLLVGLAAALLATLLGTAFGAQAGYFGGRVDDFFNWLYSVLTSIPYLLLILAIAAVLNQKGVTTVVLILGLTGWTGIFRLVRAEYLKHKVREYVQAADAIGASDTRRMFVHILPNVSHVVLVQLSLHVVLFIKSEVILSFLGFGVGVETVSWGSMLNEAANELLIGAWWQLAAATAAMAVLVTAFGLFTDALRDALDPRLK